MVGFGYQLRVCLLHAVERWLAAPAGPPSVFAEFLSDEVALADITVVTQVKLRETRGSTVSALKQLWSVWDVARSLGLHEDLRLRILYRHAGAAGVRDALDTWQPEDASELDVVEFRTRVSVEVSGDVDDALLALLANRLGAREPLRLMHEWTGRLLDGAQQPDGFVAATRSIWDALAGMRNASAPLGFHVFDDADQAPALGKPGAVLTGQRPRLRHFKDGYFAPREQLVDAVLGRIGGKDPSHDELSDGTLGLPVFWIGGRSGSGKSVLLLQAMGRLHANGAGPVLWLRNDPTTLPAAIRWLKANSPDRRGVIAIDDPWAPAAADTAAAVWRDALALVDELIDEEAALPLLLCCGPTEQATQMQRQLTDSVAIEVFELPNDTTDEHDALRRWFRQRTGKDAPDVGDDNVLLVQLFFEWRVGEGIESFAKRFRERVVAADPSGALLEAMARVLALNRLYVSYAEDALTAVLTAAQRDALGRLQADNHIALDEEQQGGLRLAHPHLANALFNAWFPVGEAPAQRAEHLRHALLAALRHGARPADRLAPVRAVVRQLLDTPPDSSPGDRRVDEGTLEVLADLYPTFLAADDSLDPDQKDWVVGAWLPLAARGMVDVDPDPFEVALTLLDGSIRGDGTLVLERSLLQNVDALPDGRREALVARLQEQLSATMDAGPTGALLRLAIKSTVFEHFMALAASWLRGHPRHRGAGPLIEACLSTGRTAAVLDMVREGLPHSAATGRWAGAAVALYEADPAARSLVVDWARRHRRHPMVGRLLAFLVRAGEDAARPWIDEWFAENGVHAHDTRVIEVLLEERGPDEELLDVCRERLKASDGRSSYLGSALVRFAGAPEVNDMLLDAIDRRIADEPSWAYVWEALFRRSPSEGLYPYGLIALDMADPQRMNWNYTFEVLAEFAMAPELRARALRWLRIRFSGVDPISGARGPYDPAWGFVFARLADDEICAELGALATELLTEHPDTPNWPWVWANLRFNGAGDEFYEAAVGWLEAADLAHGAFATVLRAALRNCAVAEFDRIRTSVLPRAAADRRGDLASIFVEAWLDDVSSDEVFVELVELVPVATPAFITLWDRTVAVDAPLEAEMYRRAMRWLITTGGRNREWYAIWIRAWRRTSSPALDYVTQRWLCTPVMVNEPIYPVVLRQALDRWPRHPDLRSAALAGLDTMEGAAWIRTWQVLWTDRPDDDLRCLGEARLASEAFSAREAAAMRKLVSQDRVDVVRALGRA